MRTRPVTNRAQRDAAYVSVPADAGPRDARGLARVTLARKLAAITLRLWKKGERYDPTQLTIPAR